MPPPVQAIGDDVDTLPNPPFLSLFFFYGGRSCGPLRPFFLNLVLVYRIYPLLIVPLSPLLCVRLNLCNVTLPNVPIFFFFTFIELSSPPTTRRCSSCLRTLTIMFLFPCSLLVILPQVVNTPSRHSVFPGDPPPIILPPNKTDLTNIILSGLPSRVIRAEVF